MYEIRGYGNERDFLNSRWDVVLDANLPRKTAEDLAETIYCKGEYAVVAVFADGSDQADKVFGLN